MSTQAAPIATTTTNRRRTRERVTTSRSMRLTDRTRNMQDSTQRGPTVAIDGAEVGGDVRRSPASSPQRSRMERAFMSSPSKYASRPGIHEIRVPSNDAGADEAHSRSGDQSWDGTRTSASARTPPKTRRGNHVEDAGEDEIGPLT